MENTPKKKRIKTKNFNNDIISKNIITPIITHLAISEIGKIVIIVNQIMKKINVF